MLVPVLARTSAAHQGAMPVGAGSAMRIFDSAVGFSACRTISRPTESAEFPSCRTRSRTRRHAGGFCGASRGGAAGSSTAKELRQRETPRPMASCMVTYR